MSTALLISFSWLSLHLLKKHFEVSDFFDKIYVLLNVVGASCKRQDMIREDQRKIIEEGVSHGEIKTGKRLNQERSIQRLVLLVGVLTTNIC